MASVGLRHVLARVRPTNIDEARPPAPPGGRRRRPAAGLAVLVALSVGASSIGSWLPGRAAGAAGQGSVQPGSIGSRLAVGGGVRSDVVVSQRRPRGLPRDAVTLALSPVLLRGEGVAPEPADDRPPPDFDEPAPAPGPRRPDGGADPGAGIGELAGDPVGDTAVAAGFLPDGTLVKPVVVPTTLVDPVEPAEQDARAAVEPPTGGTRGQDAAAQPVDEPATYTGGAMTWPVVGGRNRVSRGFRRGHLGLDIAADHGTKVVAVAEGVVIFAGWKRNGGGYQVHVAHGSGLYTTYNHLSGVSVGVGQAVEKGQRVGRIGSTGWSTGPHLHFEVWRGGIWDGGKALDPLSYL